MKKVLLLLCVCVSLAASAAITPDKRATLHDVSRDKVIKQHKFQDLIKTTVTPSPGGASYKQFMDGAKKSLQDKKARPENLVNKRAPRRLSAEEIISKPYVCFLYAYDFLFDTGELVSSDPYYAGNGAYWYPDASDGLYFAGFYWDNENSTYYLPLDIDYSTGEVALPWGMLLRDDSIIGSARTRTDTVWYELLVSEAFFFEGEQTDCMGTLHEDGSIIFDDNYVYYFEQVLIDIRNGRVVSTDTTYGAKMYVGTEILAANGLLDYILEKDGSSQSNYVYMFQDADSVFVGNLWDYGVSNAKMVLTSDYKMYYPCAELDPTGSNIYLSNPIWDVNDTWIDGGLGEFYPLSGYEVDESGYIVDFIWGMDGTAIPEQVTWPFTALCNGYHVTYGFLNNRLTWLNGGKFIIPVDTPVIIRGDANNDGEIDIYDVITLIDHLRCEDFDDSDTFNGDNADADANGEISFADIDALYEFLITGAWPEQL